LVSHFLAIEACSTATIWPFIWKLATTLPTTLAGVAAVLQLANEIEDAGLEWPDTDAVGAEGWHYQLRATMAAVIEAHSEGSCVMAEIFKFPYDASRRVHSRKPRRSKNGTPEERAAKAAAMETSPADVVPMSLVQADARSEVDRRKLRGSPLRNYIATISFGATVVGRMHTAGLKGEPLAAVQSEIGKEWLETLDRALEALATVGLGLIQAVQTLKALESETSDFPGKFTGPRRRTTCPKFSDRARPMKPPAPIPEAQPAALGVSSKTVEAVVTRS
jgi:hypothetical protein